MKKLLQLLRDGTLYLREVPEPRRPDGFLLVANRASLISAGTERSTVQAARASLLGKARQRPDKVRQVLDNVRKEGVRATLSKVRAKLGEPEPLGYSTAGTVLDPDPSDPRALPSGTPVACAGVGYASHAEVVVVPRNLVVPLPEGVSFEQGCFATLGAIALQGVRRAGVSVGERVLVIGLGLLGQLTWQLLEHAGCRVIGTDVSERAVELARSIGLERALVRGKDDVEDAVARLTGGHGVDAVIITASTKSRDPVELAGAACRERGRVVVVGAVNMDVPRDPHYYRKELDLVLSRSYGPGRYDPEYEEKGHDYPYGFVRWTEQRNMQAFLEAVAAGAVRVEKLITHRFPFERAPEAYDIVSGKVKEFHVGIVLQYGERPDLARRVELPVSRPAPTEGTVRVAFLGAGSFAKSYLLPHLKDRPDVDLVAVATARGFTATEAARRFGFREARSDAPELAVEDGIDVVFIATRHDEHAPLAGRALATGKHVFVEKPLAVSPEHLAELLPILAEARGILQVGFNRRFSPLAVALRERLAVSSSPCQVTYRVNAGPLPRDHWLLDPEQGGGRIVGEGCHFIDLMQFLVNAQPIRVQATRFGDDAEGATTAVIDFADGSVGVLVYQANASTRVRKERIEAFAAGRGGIIDDWSVLELYEGRSVTRKKVSGQAKGYKEEIEAFLDAVRTGKPAIEPESLVWTTLATFAIEQSVRERRPVDLLLPGEEDGAGPGGAPGKPGADPEESSAP